MRGNTITLRLIKGAIGQASGLFQYDYGQKLILSGVELPANYEVHFSNCEYGNSKTMLGNSTGVDIPDEYLLSGEDVHVWLFLHDGADDGETEYHGIINVVRRAQPTDEPPTPQEQSVIAQAIAVLNEAVEQTAQDVIDANAAKEAAESAAESAEDARDEAVSAKDTAVDAKDAVEDAKDMAVSAKDAAIAAKDAAEASADAAEAAKDIAEEAIAQIHSVIDDEAGHGVTDKTWSADKILRSIPEVVPVKDVKINESSIVDGQGSANIPKAGVSTFGVMRAPNPVSSGLQMDPLGYLKTTEANTSQVQGGTNEYRVIVPNNQHEAVFFGLAKAAGRDLKDVRNVTVGQYPENAKTAIRNMLGVQSSGAVIDDTAGAGAIDKAWSANKLVTEFGNKLNAPSLGEKRNVLTLDNNRRPAWAENINVYEVTIPVEANSTSLPKYNIFNIRNDNITTKSRVIGWESTTAKYYTYLNYTLESAYTSMPGVVSGDLEILPGAPAGTIKLYIADVA